MTQSQLDLRPGGRWIVGFQVPDGPVFREVRTLTVVERPRRIAFDMRVIEDGTARFSTAVDVTVERMQGGHRVCLAQQGFATGSRVTISGSMAKRPRPDWTTGSPDRVGAERRHRG